MDVENVLWATKQVKKVSVYKQWNNFLGIPKGKMAVNRLHIQCIKAKGGIFKIQKIFTHENFWNWICALILEWRHFHSRQGRHERILSTQTGQTSNWVKMIISGVPGWLSQLSFWLQLRSWSYSWWVRAPCQALCSQLRAWSLLRILYLPLSLLLLHSCSVSLCIKNKYEH